MAMAEQIFAADRAADNVPRVLTLLARYHGLSDVQLASVSGLPRSTVRTRRTGDQQCTASDLAKFGAVFGVPVPVFYLAPDDALRWILDHPEDRPLWLSEQGVARSRWNSIFRGYGPAISDSVLSVA